MSSYRRDYDGARETYGRSLCDHDVYRPSRSRFTPPRDNYYNRRPTDEFDYRRPTLYSYNHNPEAGPRNLNAVAYRERDRVRHRPDAEQHTSPYAFQAFLPPVRSRANSRPERLTYDQDSSTLRQLQKSLAQPSQKLPDGPFELSASRTSPAKSQSWFVQSTPKEPSTRGELLTTVSASPKVDEGAQAIAMSADEVFASEIAAQRIILADREKVVEAEKWKRLAEQRTERGKATTEQKAEKRKRIAEREAEMEVQRVASRKAKMEAHRLAEEKAKMEREILVEQRAKMELQREMEKLSLTQQRAKMKFQREAERQHHMRRQEKLLEQIYAEHKIDVVKMGTPSGGAMYAPWDSTLGSILDEQKEEVLAREGIYFWLEAGTRMSVTEDCESLEIKEVNMSG
ncbi:hypothetical protein MMC18_006039 [Xylographa bjoerkii]|nr:hypothetical protein [Xylographa bjoerkii]